MGGRDARLIRRLADRRALDRDEVDALSDEARERVGAWLEAGWLIDAEDASPRKEERR
jgi:50S ribosomal protein L16 3-hydroxylase